VTQLHQIQNLVDSAIDRYGQIDVLFNNAGLGWSKPLNDQEPEKEIDLQLRVNISGVLQATRAALPHMIQRRHGHIINMSSIAGLVGTPNLSVYSASKYAVGGFSEALRREISRYGIPVSTIHAGAVKTEFAQHSGITRKSGISTPKFLTLTAEDVARTVLRVVERPRRAVSSPDRCASVWLNRCPRVRRLLRSAASRTPAGENREFGFRRIASDQPRVRWREFEVDETPWNGVSLRRASWRDHSSS
jgi:short-subunit dehydrogenase